ncbi:MAG TPA: aldehyde dehydrogenase family protein, partial [Nitrospiria bacterium]|nr:aldehyde dehydrogenase family protein [Nitrospiria bacterium]
MQQLLYERRQQEALILFPDRRRQDRRQVFQEVVLENRRLLRSTEVSELISPNRTVSTLDSELQTFKLLVNGKDLDSGKYEYFPYADKLIVDPRTTIQIIKDLKTGKIPENYEKYILAKYCIGTIDTNLQAMVAAHEASMEFRYFPISKRVKILTDVYELMLYNRERLIGLMVAEGHPWKLAEWEFSGMEQIFRKESLDFYKSHLSRKIGVEGKEVLYWKRKPDGVVCVSPPKNAPCSSSIIAGFALLGGNTLIIK